MKSQIVKRVNINLTKREIKALQNLEDEMQTRNTPISMSDLIRDAIVGYCNQQTGTNIR